MGKRLGDAFLWGLSVIGLTLSGGLFLMLGGNDTVLEKLTVCSLIFLPFFGIGWLIRYIFTGRTDLWLSPTNTGQPNM